MIPKKILLFACAFLSPIFFLSSCGPKDHGPDVSNIKVQLHSARFDEDLYAIDTNHVGEGLQQLAGKYPDFLNFYLDTILAYEVHGNYNDTVKGIRDGLRVYLTYKDYVDLEDTIKRQFPDTREADAALSGGFQYMKYYFPEYHVPKVLYVDLNLSKLPAFTIDTTILGVCLDMFLGPRFLPYTQVGIPGYLGPHLRHDYIPVAAFSVIYNSRYPFVTDDKTMLELMVERGKEQYFLHAILPHTADSVLFGFTQLQAKWCDEHEELVYNFFKNNLYNKDPAAILPYVNDGPFAQGLEPVTDPVKCTPGNIGSWLGYKIVSAYMSMHPKMPLSDLLEKKNNAQEILDDANYRPKDKS